MAGLWETWKDPQGNVVPSCTIITTAANDFLAPIHDRMPVILPRESEESLVGLRYRRCGLSNRNPRTLQGRVHGRVRGVDDGELLPEHRAGDHCTGLGCQSSGIAINATRDTQCSPAPRS